LTGAHNTEGVGVLIDSIREEFPTTRWHVLFAAMGDKRSEAMMEQLAPLAAGVVVTQVDSPRAVPAGDLAATAGRLVDGPVVVGATVDEAVDMVRAEAGPEGAVLVTGSLYLVGQVRDLLVGRAEPSR
jgi:dihydrofolate synthase/folylpolyglutamate synthase